MLVDFLCKTPDVVRISCENTYVAGFPVESTAVGRPLPNWGFPGSGAYIYPSSLIWVEKIVPPPFLYVSSGDFAGPDGFICPFLSYLGRKNCPANVSLRVEWGLRLSRWLYMPSSSYLGRKNCPFTVSLRVEWGLRLSRWLHMLFPSCLGRKNCPFTVSLRVEWGLRRSRWLYMPFSSYLDRKKLSR